MTDKKRPRNHFNTFEMTILYNHNKIFSVSLEYSLLTDAVCKFGTAEKWHLSNLSNTSQNFCPMMVLTIGHKMDQKNCPLWAPGLENHFGPQIT